MTKWKLLSETCPVLLINFNGDSHSEFISESVDILYIDVRVLGLISYRALCWDLG